MKNVILTDVDGVLLDWAAGFDNWMMAQGFQHVPGNEHAYLIDQRFIDVEYNQSKKLIREFNESKDVGNLMPLRDSIDGVRMLSSHGYRFGVITSHSDVDHACKQREENLLKHFGDVFEFFVHLPTGSDKDEALDPYRGTNLWWVEDKAENALAGRDRGLRSLLMHHEFNADDQLDGVVRVKNWREIYNTVMSVHNLI
jgi:phosphoglycolate phosphatase-like HAD superfamily hydrolase